MTSEKDNVANNIAKISQEKESKWILIDFNPCGRIELVLFMISMG